MQGIVWSCIVVVNALFVNGCLQMLLVQRCMSEVYLFTHVDGLCSCVGYCQASQPLSSAAALPYCVTPQCCSLYPGVLGQASIKRYWKSEKKRKQSGCLGLWPLYRTLICIPDHWIIERNEDKCEDCPDTLPSSGVCTMVELPSPKAIHFIGVLKYSHVQWKILKTQETTRAAMTSPASGL